MNQTAANLTDNAVLTTATAQLCHDGARCEAQLDKLARKIAALGLSAPACLFLELHKPLTTILQTAVLGLEPLAAPFINTDYWAGLRNSLSSPDNVDLLIQRIEQYAAGGGKS